MDQETIEQLESGEIKRQEVIQIELNKYFEKLGVMPKLTLKKRRMKISEALTKYSYDNQLWNNLSQCWKQNIQNQVMIMSKLHKDKYDNS